MRGVAEIRPIGADYWLTRRAVPTPATPRGRASMKRFEIPAIRAPQPPAAAWRKARDQPAPHSAAHEQYQRNA